MHPGAHLLPEPLLVLGEYVVVQQRLSRADAVGRQPLLSEPVEDLLQGGKRGWAARVGVVN